MAPPKKPRLLKRGFFLFLFEQSQYFIGNFLVENHKLVPDEFGTEVDKHHRSGNYHLVIFVPARAGGVLPGVYDRVCAEGGQGGERAVIEQDETHCKRDVVRRFKGKFAVERKAPYYRKNEPYEVGYPIITAVFGHQARPG